MQMRPTNLSDFYPIWERRLPSSFGDRYTFAQDAFIASAIRQGGKHFYSGPENGLFGTFSVKISIESTVKGWTSNPLFQR